MSDASSDRRGLIRTLAESPRSLETNARCERWLRRAKGARRKEYDEKCVQEGVGGTRDMARAKPDYDGDLVIGFRDRKSVV